MSVLEKRVDVTIEMGDAIFNALSNPCESCYIAQNYNLEDDDSPCQNCGVEE